MNFKSSNFDPEDCLGKKPRLQHLSITLSSADDIWFQTGSLAVLNVDKPEITELPPMLIKRNIYAVISYLN